MTLLRPAVRELRAAVAAAPDAKLGRIVGMLDSLLDRSATDELLAAARPRLRRLRPARPLRFLRLLSMPLEGALVAPLAWTRAPGEIPRSALTPLAEAVRAALEEEAERIELAGCGHSTAEAGLVGALGRGLWPRAGALDLGVPPGWEAAGLPREAAAPILALARALWRHGAALWEARLAGPEGPPEPLLRAALGPLAAEGPEPLTAGATLLLRHAEAPARVVAAAAALSARVAAPLERELEAELTRHAAAVPEAGTAGMAAEAVALDARLADAEALACPVNREARRRVAARLRRQAAATCRDRFATALEQELLDPAARLAAGGPAGDAAVAALEETARELRRLEAAAVRLEPDVSGAPALAAALPRLAALGAPGLGRAEVARLVEILAGPEAALPLAP